MLQHILFARLDNVSPTDISRADDRQAHAPATTHTYILAALRVCTRPRPLPPSLSFLNSVSPFRSRLAPSLSLTLSLSLFSLFFHSHLFFQRFPSSSPGDFLTMERRAKLAVKREGESKERKEKVATAMSRAQFLAPFSFEEALGAAMGKKS